MKYFSKNTLAYYNDAPQTHRHNLSDLPVSVFGASTLLYKTNCGHTSPNDDAVLFYTLNHCASIVRKSFTLNEPLPEWAQEIMHAYTTVLADQGERMLHYLFCITTREMRHLKSCTGAFWTKVETTFNAQSVTVLKDISSNGAEETAMSKYLKAAPETMLGQMSIGQYVKTLSYAYHKAGASGWNGSYGGPPWGNITDSLVSFLHGETSLEMMVDTGFTLAHNTAPMFNKGMMYHSPDSHFMTILDVQRSGQMLDLMLAPDTQTLNVKKVADAVKAAQAIKQAFPKEVKGFIDWKLVNELRPETEKNSAPTKYHKVMAAQKQPAAAAKPKTVKPVETLLKGKAIKVTGTWQVYPHQTVSVYERVSE